MDFQTIQNEVIAKLQETAIPSYWTLAEIKANINRGYREIYRQTGFVTKTSAALVISGSGYPLPTDILLPKAVYYAGSKIDQTNADYLDSIDPTWQTLAGTTNLKWLLYNSQIRLYPLPGAPGTVTMRYVAAPAALVNNADVAVFPAEYHDALTYYAVAECFMREGDGHDAQKAQQYLSLFQRVVKEFNDSLNQWKLTSQGQTGNDFQSMVFQVKSKLDENPTPMKFSVEEIKSAINRAYRELYKQTGHVTKISASLVISGSGYPLPTDFLLPKAVYYAGSKIDQTTTDNLDAIDPAWQTTAGTPTKWFFHNSQIRLYPLPGAPGTVTMRYIAAPVALVAATDLIVFPVEYKDAILYHTLAECFNREGEGQNIQKAQAWLGQFSKMVQDFTQGMNQWNLVSQGQTGTDLQSLIFRVKSKLNEAPTPVKFAVEEIKAAINRGVLEFARLSEFKNTTATLVASGTGYTIPTGMLTPKAVYVDGSKVDQTSLEYLDNTVPGWMAQTGTPSKWYFNSNLIYLYPLPSGVVVAKLRYLPKPAVLSAMGDTPEIQIEYVDAVVNWASFELLSKSPQAANLETAKLHQQLFSSLLSDYKKSLEVTQADGYGETGQNFGGLIYRVKSKLDEVPAAKIFTTEEIKSAINRGVYEFARQTEFRTTFANLVASGNGYTIPSGMLAPKALFVDGRKIDQTTAEYLDGLSATWISETGIPTKWLFYNGRIYLYPLPTAGVTVSLRYIQKPLSLSATTDIPEIQIEYFDAIWQYAIFELLGSKPDSANSQVTALHKGLFDKAVSDFRMAHEVTQMASGGETDTTLGGLLYRTLRELKKFGGQKIFQLDEIKSAINNGYREFVKKTQCKSKMDFLVGFGNGTFQIPNDLLVPLKVYCNNLPLDQIKDTSLDDFVAGTGRKLGVIGEDSFSGSDWRTGTGDTPLFWVISQGRIFIYPKPQLDYLTFTSVSESGLAPGQESGVIAANTTTITLVTAIAMDKSRVLLFLGNTLQQSSKYNITTPNRIVLTSPVLGQTPWNTKTCTRTEEGTILAGTDLINLAQDVFYPNQVEFYLGGTLQSSPADYSFVTSKIIQLNANVPADTPWKMAVTAQLGAGGMTINLVNNIEMDTSKILVFLGNTLQQKIEYEIRTPKKIVILSPVPGITPWSTKTCANSEEGTILAGSDLITLSHTVDYPEQIEFYLGGTLQSYLNDFTFPSPNKIQLNVPVPGNAPWKMAWLYNSAAKMLYVPNPVLLAEKNDSPADIPEAFREALVFFAVQEILFFESKAARVVAMRKQQFEDMIKDYSGKFSAPINKIPAMPFLV